MPKEPEPTPLIVLVPEIPGWQAVDDHPTLRPVLYEPGQDVTPEQREARAIVVGFARVDETAALMAAVPELELVQTLNAGFDQWVPRLPPGVALSNCRGAHGRSTAEWVVAALLAHVRELTAFAASHGAGHWDQRFTGTLDGLRVAILGAGDIATHARAMLEPFNAHVTLVGRSARDDILDMDGFRLVQGEQDVIVLAVPVTAETTGMVDAAFLATMKDGAILVNAGRGLLVDTEALMAATADGRIHAIVDVTEPEPLPDGHPMWSAPGITITPHVAGATNGLFTRAWSVAIEQLEAHARGEQPPNLVVEGA